MVIKLPMVSDLFITDIKNEASNRKLFLNVGKDQNGKSLLDFIKKMNSHFDGMAIFLNEVDEESHFSFSRSLDLELNTEKHLRLANTFINNENVIGYQRNVISKADIVNVNLGMSLSLSDLRNDINIAEPILRDAETIVLDPSVIRSSDIAYLGNSIPSGLFSEEACQVCKYIGTSSRFKIFELVLIDEFKSSDKWLPLYGEMIWYFLEGFYISIEDHPKLSKMQSYYIIGDDLDLDFVQSEISGRWWIKKGEEYFSCTEDEYQKAASGEISKRLSALLFNKAF